MTEVLYQEATTSTVVLTDAVNKFVASLEYQVLFLQILGNVIVDKPDPGIRWVSSFFTKCVVSFVR